MKKNLIGAIVLIAAIALTGCGNKNNQKNEEAIEEKAPVTLSAMKINAQELPPRMLIIVDPQNDFVKGGALATEKGAEALDVLANALNSKHAQDYSWIIATQDMHPKNHCSFQEQGGTFPPHCVQGTKGAEIYPPLKETLKLMMEKGFQVHFMRKGDQAEKEEFSVFQNEHNGEKLRRTIQEFENFDGIDVCGIATDYCVYQTVKDLIEFYPAEKVRVVTNCIAAVDENDTKLAKLMKEKGIKGIEF